MLCVVVLAGTGVQLNEPPAPAVFLNHHAAVQLDRVSVAPVCVSDPAVRPTVENSASVEALVISVAQVFSLYAL